jgi:phage tail sheath protein FI
LSDPTWSYINVRRLFIMIEELVDEGTKFVVFEPKTPDLWARVRLTVTNFVDGVALGRRSARPQPRRSTSYATRPP